VANRSYISVTFSHTINNECLWISETYNADYIELRENQPYMHVAHVYLHGVMDLVCQVWNQH